MNAKERIAYRVMDVVIHCCTYINSGEGLVITRDMIKSCERIGDNVNMTRCMFARMLNKIGYSNESIGGFMGRTESTVRDMLSRGDAFRDTRFAYRVAEEEAVEMVKSILKECE